MKIWTEVGYEAYPKTGLGRKQNLGKTELYKC